MDHIIEGEIEPVAETEEVPTAAGNKCDHGVYLAADERESRVARYCHICNPEINRIIAPRKRVPTLHTIERDVCDADEFLSLPVGARLAASGQYLEA